MGLPGPITDKWHRVCVSCGKRVHLNKIKGPETYHCEECGGTLFTRDKSKVES